ncbi:MAG: nucleoside hydrolase [Planctomycetes bacterium]|jgi:inosine-uridine nucleoside N-ribohydrolase|nr:nucleoside hydrolase [Planctomycetota bacterium]
MNAEAARIILDTDIGNDVDDVLAMSMLHALQSNGECELLGVCVSKGSIWGPRLAGVINRFYQRADVPVAWVGPGGPTPDAGRFARQVCLMHPGLDEKREFQQGVDLLRRTLAAQGDMSVTVVSIGFMTNLAALLESGPCPHSPLGGRELVRRKVKLLSIMAGDFSPKAIAASDQRFGEFNIVQDPSSARSVLSNWPGLVVFTGYELGAEVLYPGSNIRDGFAWAGPHPVVDAYNLFSQMPYDRPCWDVIAAMYAVRPDLEDLRLSPPGKVGLFPAGNTSFAYDASGRHFHLTINPGRGEHLQRMFTDLCSQPVQAACAR